MSVIYCNGMIELEILMRNYKTWRYFASVHGMDRIFLF
jgi:hypothetical protein